MRNIAAALLTIAIAVLSFIVGYQAAIRTATTSEGYFEDESFFLIVNNHEYEWRK